MLRVNSSSSSDAPRTPSPLDDGKGTGHQHKFPSTLLDFQRMFYAKQFEAGGGSGSGSGGFGGSSSSVHGAVNQLPTVFNPKIVVAAAACQAAALEAVIRSCGGGGGGGSVGGGGGKHFRNVCEEVENERGGDELDNERERKGKDLFLVFWGVLRKSGIFGIFSAAGIFTVGIFGQLFFAVV